MAKLSGFNEELRDAFASMDIGNINNIRRVVIDVDLSNNRQILVYVEHYGDENLINVVRAMSGVEVKIVGTKGDES